jgi:REP element-mobilizing transposase RayT
MSHTYTANLVHVVFSTKDRANSIPDEQLPRLVAYLESIARAEKVRLVIAGGTTNHLHMLVAVPPARTLADVVQKLKANTSRFMGPRFSWQQGYGAFSVSPSQAKAVIDYIRNQREHHAKWQFEDEFVTLLRKCGIEFDSKYVFG